MAIRECKVAKNKKEKLIRFYQNVQVATIMGKGIGGIDIRQKRQGPTHKTEALSENFQKDWIEFKPSLALPKHMLFSIK